MGLLYISKTHYIFATKMSDRKITIRTISLIIVLSMLFGTPAFSDSSTVNNESVTTSIENISPNQNDFWYNENIWLDISKDGWIWSRASLVGSDILFGDEDLGLLMQLDILNSFRHIRINVRDNDNPWDDNANVNFRFQTNDPALAEQYANLILLIIGQSMKLELRFDGSNGFDDNDRDDVWRSFTDVRYNGHIDWLDMQSVINTAIPRQLGGLAASIDATYATDLSFYFWLERDNKNIAGSIGLNYQGQISQLSGGHSVSYRDLMHINNFEKSPYSNDFYVSANLPDVTNPVFDVQPTINWNYHPNPEGWDYFHYWDGGFSIPAGSAYNDIVLTFDFEFKPWAFVNQDNYWWSVDPRGYDSMSVEATGNNRIAPTSQLYAQSPMLENVSSLELWIDQNGLRLQVGFYNGSHDIEYNDILLELETLGLDYTSISFQQNNSQWDWHNWVDDQYYLINWYEAYLPNTSFTYKSVIEAMPGYQKSAILQYTNLTNFDNFVWRIDPDDWSNGAQMTLHRNALGDQNIPLNQVDRLYNDVNTLHSANLLTPYLAGWNGTIPWNNYTETLSLSFEAPFEGQLENINFVPDKNNGLYWDSGRWTWNRNKYNYFNYNFRIYKENPQLTSDDSLNTPIGPLTDISLSFNNNFEANTVDIDPPNIDDVRYSDILNSDYDNWSGDFDTNPISGLNYIVAKANDQPDWRFTPSGIKQVNSSLFRTDAPVDHEKFLFHDTLTYSDTWPTDVNSEAWRMNLDTTNFADGDYELWFELEDNSNNRNNWGSIQLEIDNYDITYQPATIIWDQNSPNDGSTIAGLMNFDFVVQDDAGSFAVVVWSNLGGYVVEADNVVTNTSGVFEFYSFELDTLFEPENMPLTLKIEVLDMDGHWTNTHRSYTVDNYISGNRPTVNLLDPLNNAQFDSSEHTEIEFSVEIIEDVGVKSAKIFFSGPITIDFALSNNIGTDIWMETVNILSWDHGTYNWYVEVVDMDENIHFVTSEIRTFELLGDAPLVEDNEPPVLSNLNYADNDVVSGEITIEVRAVDNVGVQEVTIEYFDGQLATMTDSGNNYYEYNLNTADVVDGKYTIKLTAKDFKGNYDSLSVTLEFDNGRKDKSPGIGIPGFGFYLTITSILSLILVYRKKMRKY